MLLILVGCRLIAAGGPEVKVAPFQSLTHAEVVQNQQQFNQELQAPGSGRILSREHEQHRQAFIDVSIEPKYTPRAWHP